LGFAVSHRFDRLAKSQQAQNEVLDVVGLLLKDAKEKVNDEELPPTRSRSA
jgi:beta-lactam-binding protein with PASTA domain